MTPEPAFFTCVCCQQRFRKIGTDEEMRAEAKARFGDDAADKDVPKIYVCDDCDELLLALLEDEPES